MRIGELSARTGTSRRMLRYYEEQGLLKPVRRQSGYREYDEQDVYVLEIIKYLQSAGLTLNTIKAIQPCLRDDTLEINMCPKIVGLLTEEKRKLDTRIEELTRYRDSFHGLLDRFQVPATPPASTAATEARGAGRNAARRSRQ